MPARAAATTSGRLRRRTAKATAATCSTRWSSTQLPFGKGKAINPVKRRRARAGQRLAHLQHHAPALRHCPTASSPRPATLPNAGGCRASYNPAFTGDVRINGEWGSGDLLGARPQFLDPQRLPQSRRLHLRRHARRRRIRTLQSGLLERRHERHAPVRHHRAHSKLDFSAEAFNVTNSVIFNGPASLDINNANFGRITGQQNTPRSFQLRLKLQF